jgi:hypothetical protein
MPLMDIKSGLTGTVSTVNQPQSGLMNQPMQTQEQGNPFAKAIENISGKYGIPKDKAYKLMVAAHAKRQQQAPIGNLKAKVDSMMGEATGASIEAPSQSIDMGDYAGALGSKSKAGKLGSLMDKTLGTGFLGTAFDAGYSVASQGQLSAAAPSLARSALGMLSAVTGAPIGRAIGMFDKAARGVKTGMAPHDALLGSLADFGLDTAIIGLSSLAGPIGTLLGGIAAGAIDISSITDGLMQDASDWGKEMQAAADVNTRGFMEPWWKRRRLDE